MSGSPPGTPIGSKHPGQHRVQKRQAVTACRLLSKGPGKAAVPARAAKFRALVYNVYILFILTIPRLCYMLGLTYRVAV